MASLMESALDDGEEAMVITSDYVTISCLVTSASGPVSFETGEPLHPAYTTPKGYVLGTLISLEYCPWPAHAVVRERRQDFITRVPLGETVSGGSEHGRNQQGARVNAVVLVTDQEPAFFAKSGKPLHPLQPHQLPIRVPFFAHVCVCFVVCGYVLRLRLFLRGLPRRRRRPHGGRG